MTINQINGTDNNDILLDTNLDDEIYALGGNDEIETTGGNDIIYGDLGTDKLTVNYASYNQDLNIYFSYYDPFIGDGSINIDLFDSNGNLTSNIINFYSIEELEIITGSGNDNIALENGFYIIDGGSGYDILNLDFGNNYNGVGVTSNLSSNNSGEYISDESTVEFSNIEAVNVTGSSYDDVLAAPISSSNNGLISSVNGNGGFDELVVDLSDNNQDYQLTLDVFGGSLNNYNNQTGYEEIILNFSDIEKFNLTTGGGFDWINLGIDSYSDDIINTGAGDDEITPGKGYDVVDGGSGYDFLNLNFTNDDNGVTSSLDSSKSGEYISDESTVEFSNIEAVNVYGSYYDDVLAAPIGSNNGAISNVNGNSGFDELVVDLSDNNQDYQLTLDFDGGYLNSYNNQLGYEETILYFSDIEKFNLTTGGGFDWINLGIDSYSDDVINTGAGDDEITPGKGYDVVDGGSGYDVLNLDFTNDNSGVISSLDSNNSGEYVSDESTVEFSNIESVNVAGSSYDDVLVAPIGNSNNGFIPYVNGNSGFDELVVDLSDNNRDYQLTLDIYDDYLNNYNNQTGYGETILSFNDIEKFNITTGRGFDSIDLGIASYSHDIINMGAGNDNIISTGKGYDVVDGGSGYDILNLDFGTSSSGVTSSLNNSNSGEYISNEGAIDSNIEFSNIEAVSVIGSSYNDVLVAPLGNSNNNSNEFIPYIDGGEGFDELVLDLSDRNDSLQIDNADGLNINSIDNPTYYKYLDIYSIEAFNLTTGRGNDNINLDNGLYSNDTINTGAGNDTISTGNGYDVIDGGSGYDILNLNFANSLSGVFSTLSSGNSGEYINDEGTIGGNEIEFSNIEAVSIIGSSYNDVLAAPLGNNNNSSEFIPYIDGGEGFDELVLDLSDRNDSLSIDNLSDLNINSLDNPINNNYLNIYSIEAFNITTGRGNDDIVLEQLIYSNETINAGRGNDFIAAGRGNDVVDGGNGYDVLDLDFSNSLSGVTSSLSNNNNGEYTTNEDSVEFSNIEAINVYGSSYNDVLVAPVNTNYSAREYPLFPTISGGEGTDELVVNYSSIQSDMSIYSNPGGNLSADILAIGQSVETNYDSIEIINLTGSEGNDEIMLDTSNENISHVVDGGAGDDTISFGIDSIVGNNIIDGGDGFDILNLDFSMSGGVNTSSTINGNIILTSDGGTIEFINIEEINMLSSTYEDFTTV